MCSRKKGGRFLGGEERRRDGVCLTVCSTGWKACEGANAGGATGTRERWSCDWRNTTTGVGYWSRLGLEPLEGRTTGAGMGLDGVRFQSGDVENGALDEALNHDS